MGHKSIRQDPFKLFLPFLARFADVVRRERMIIVYYTESAFGITRTAICAHTDTLPEVVC